MRIHTTTSFFSALLAASLLTSCFHRTDLPLLTAPTEKRASILINNATLFSGNPADGVTTNANVLIENGVIGKITVEDIDAPNAHVINADGKMVIPGLIDAHVHVFGSGAPPSLPALPNPERNATAFLYAGITTIVDMGGPVDELEELSRKIDAGELTGPRLFYPGRIFTCEDGHPAAMIRRMVPWFVDEIIVSKMVYEVGDDDDIRSMVLENKNHGATFSKLVVDEIPLQIPTFTSDQIATVVARSREEGFTTVAHIGTEENIVTAMDGGVRVFIHGPYRSELSDATVERLRSSGCIVTPTLAVFDNVVRYGDGSLEISRLDQEISDPVILAEYRKPAPEDTDQALADWVRNAAAYQDIKFANVMKMKAAGIPILAGSDSINVASAPGPTLHRELELLVDRCGFTPLEAVAAATYETGRTYSAVSGLPPLGYLKAGLPADLLILNGDVREDISNVQNIDTIILNGQVVSRATPAGIDGD